MQGAGVDGEGVGIDAAQVHRAIAVLGETAGIDGAKVAAKTVGVDGSTAADQCNLPIRSREVAIKLERAAAKSQTAVGVAEIHFVADGQDAAIERCAAAVGIRT